jgi:hypothetical protein
VEAEEGDVGEFNFCGNVDVVRVELGGRGSGWGGTKENAKTF